MQGRGPQGDGGLADHRVHPDDGGVGQGGDDGTGQDGLDHDHGGGGIEQAQEAQGAAPGEKEVEEEPGHHRRQAHAGVDQADDQTPEGHPAPGQGRPQGQAQDGGDHQGRSRDLQGQEDDGQELGVDGEDELPGPDESVEDGVHKNMAGRSKVPALDLPRKLFDQSVNCHRPGLTSSGPPCQADDFMIWLAPLFGIGNEQLIPVLVLKSPMAVWPSGEISQLTNYHGLFIFQTC